MAFENLCYVICVFERTDDEENIDGYTKNDSERSEEVKSLTRNQEKYIL